MVLLYNEAPGKVYNNFGGGYHQELEGLSRWNTIKQIKDIKEGKSLFNLEIQLHYMIKMDLNLRISISLPE